MTRQEKLEEFGKLLDVVYELREKCPWDRKQTWESLRQLTIEELYELTDAILIKDYEEMRKELGDLLLHILFYSRIGEEEEKFDIGDISKTLREKLIVRHPHIYGEVKVDNAQQVKENWEQIKLKEGKNRDKKVLSGVPAGLPSLVKAVRLQDKASAVGFDWKDIKDVWAKVDEELKEFSDEAHASQPVQEKIEHEFGDLLFSLVNLARFLDIQPDNALERTNQKFIHRFNYIEEKARENGLHLKDMSLEEMDRYWNEAKGV